MREKNIAGPPRAGGENVVSRLRQAIQSAKADGFEVRLEHLGDGQAGWCQIGPRRLLFLEASETASEQLHQLLQTLADYRAGQDRFQAAA